MRQKLSTLPTFVYVICGDWGHTTFLSSRINYGIFAGYLTDGARSFAIVWILTSKLAFVPLTNFLSKHMGRARSLNKLLSEWTVPSGEWAVEWMAQNIHNEPLYVNVSFVESQVVGKLILITSIKIITPTGLLAPTAFLVRT